MSAESSLRIQFSAHALHALELRGLSSASVRRIVLEPEWTLPDLARPGVVRAFGRTPETGERWVRVAYRRPSEDDVLVITAHPDRDAKPPEPDLDPQGKL